MRNIFKHISRTYFDIYNPLIQAYRNYPTWLFNEVSGLFDFISELMNRIASDILYPKTRESAYGFAAQCDYDPIEADGSTVIVKATLSGVMNKTINAGYQVGGQNSSGDLVIFEVTENTSVSSASEIEIPVKQKQSYSNIEIGKTNSQDDFMELPIDGYLKIIKSSIYLKDQSNLTWIRVDNFDASSSTDRHFVLLYQSNGKARVQFGGNGLGLKPPIGTSFFAYFATTLGIRGRMEIGEINLNTGEDSDISEVTNESETSGGNDAESVASIIRNARANVRLRDIVWTKEDLETTARKASASVQKVLGIPGIGAAVVQIIPAGGGNPSSPLKTQVQDHVTSKTQFGVLPVTAADPNYVAPNITASATVRNGFDETKTKNLLRFALTLTSSAIDNQIIEHYDDFGIDSCRVNVINILWSWDFTEDMNDALAFVIDQWVKLLGSQEYRTWGQPLEVGDLWIMGNSLYDYGVDVFNLTAPTTNTSTTSTQIIDSGTVTVT